MEKTLDEIKLEELLVIALGSNTYIHESIDKIYNLNKEVYYEKYERSKLKDSLFLKSYPIRYYEYFQKVIGIIEYENSAKSTLKIEGLIKKGWSKIYKIIKNNQRITYDQIIEAIYGVKKEKLNNEYLKNVSEFELFSNYLIIINLLALFNVKEVQGVEDLMSTIADNLREMYNTALNKNSNYDEFENVSEELILKYLNKNNTLLINDFFDIYIQNELDEKYYNNKLIETFETLPQQQLKRDKLFRDGESTSSLIGFYSAFLKNFGYFENKFEVELSYNELKKLDYIFNLLYKGNNLSKKHKKDDLFATCLVILGILKEHDFLLDKFNVKNEEKDNFLLKQKENEILSLKEEIIEIQKQNKNIIEKLEKDLSNKTKLEKKQIEENILLRNEIKKLRNEMLLLEDKTNQKLESFLKAENSKEKNNDIDFLENELRYKSLEDINEKIVIIGGHINFIQKISEKINKNSNIEVIDIDNFKKIESLNFNKYHKVILNTTYNNHVIYKKILSQVSRDKIIYINGSGNVSLFIEDILKKL